MGKRILLVDDEPHILDLMTIWLADDPRCGAVDRASTLDDAVARARAVPPDGILLDWRLGGVDSGSILPQLRELCPQARILVHTADRADAQRANVISLGADGIVEKATVSVNDVVEAILT